MTTTEIKVDPTLMKLREISSQEWQNAGYINVGSTSYFYPEQIPVGYLLVKVGNVVRDGDLQCFEPATLRPALANGLVGFMVTTTSFAYIRPSLSMSSGMFQAGAWLCNIGGQCRGRVNDLGHACYWCGATQPKLVPVTTAPVLF